FNVLLGGQRAEGRGFDDAVHTEGARGQLAGGANHFAQSGRRTGSAGKQSETSGVGDGGGQGRRGDEAHTRGYEGGIELVAVRERRVQHKNSWHASRA